MTDQPKWTPGPWRTVRPSNNPKKLYVRDCGGLIAEGPFPSHYEGQDERFAKEVDRYEANARLIAAAPELYEALDTLLNAPALSKVEGIVGGWSGPPEKPYSPHPPQLGARIETTCGRVYELDKAMKNARAALTRARGETP